MGKGLGEAGEGVRERMGGMQADEDCGLNADLGGIGNVLVIF